MLSPLLNLRTVVNGYNVDLAQTMNYPENYLNNNPYNPYKTEAMGYTTENTLNFFANINVMILIALCTPLAVLIIKIAANFVEGLKGISSIVLKEFFVTLMIFCALSFGFVSGLHLNYERAHYQEYTD